MFGLVVYGSLLNKKEIYLYDCSILDIVPVKISNYKRSFNLLPSVRIGIGNYKSVLNIQKSKDHYFNGLCIIYKTLDISLLDEREKGYERVLISPSNVKTYNTKAMVNNIEIYTYSGLKDKVDNSIMPNVGYLKLCLKGAQEWGKDFHDDFINSTYLNNNVSLKNFIDSDFTL